MLLFIPTLLVVSVLSFALSRVAPGDQVSMYLQSDPFGTVSSPNDLFRAERNYREAAVKLNLDKPAFYFSVTSKAFPDTLYKILLKDRREVIEKLIAQYGNWPQVEKYYQNIRQVELNMLALPDSIRRSLVKFKLDCNELYTAHQHEVVLSRLRKMEKELQGNDQLGSTLGKIFFNLKNNYNKLISGATPDKLMLPAFHWHGLNNQYHHWLANFLVGDFGISIFERRPVYDKVGPALFWSVHLFIGAIFLAFLIAVPLGVWSAVKEGKRFDKITSLGLFMLYSLPSFWVGTMLLIFFTTREYGMDIFPGTGLGNIPADGSWWEKISIAFPHLLLPIFCLAYPALAFISRQARGGMVDVLGQEYIKTARAKGLSESKVIWKHAFRNALFPLITIVAAVLPAAVAGSITIELIFNIPGIGLTTLNAIFQQDWPVVFAILMLGSVLTVVGILLADILYAVADPRVRFGNRN